MPSYWMRAAVSHPLPPSLEPSGLRSVSGPSCYCTGGRELKWAAGFMMIFPRQPVRHPHTTQNIWHVIFYSLVLLTAIYVVLGPPASERGLGENQGQSVLLASHWQWGSSLQTGITDFHFKTAFNLVDLNDLTFFCEMTVACELSQLLFERHKHTPCRDRWSSATHCLSKNSVLLLSLN